MLLPLIVVLGVEAIDFMTSSGKICIQHSILLVDVHGRVFHEKQSEIEKVYIG